MSSQPPKTQPGASVNARAGRPRTRVDLTTVDRQALRKELRQVCASEWGREPNSTELLNWVASRLGVSEAKVRKGLYGSAPVDASFLGEVQRVTARRSV
jgi:predicted nuclease of restriction endonuclease-like RecB superfamily